jgi:hypothetical protein
MALPFPNSASDAERKPCPDDGKVMSCAAYAAVGALLAGGALLLTGRRRAGMVTAVSGAALVMLDQQEVLRAWWNALPGYLEETQQLLGRVQSAVDELSAQRERLRKVLAR